MPRFRTHRSIASAWLIVIGIAAMLFLPAVAGAAQSAKPVGPLSGKSFDVVFLAESGRTLDRLVFGADQMSSHALGEKTRCAFVQTKNGVHFDASTTDDHGDTLEITGVVQGVNIHGTLVLVPKGGGTSKVINFMRQPKDEKRPKS